MPETDLVKYSPLYDDQNTLLSMLKSSNVVRLVHQQYSIWNNTAPGELLQEQIQKLQRYLDDAKS